MPVFQCDILTEWQDDSFVVWHPDSETLWQCYRMTLSQCKSVIVRACDNVTVWQCDYAPVLGAALNEASHPSPYRGGTQESGIAPLGRLHFWHSYTKGPRHKASLVCRIWAGASAYVVPCMLFLLFLYSIGDFKIYIYVYIYIFFFLVNNLCCTKHATI